MKTDTPRTDEFEALRDAMSTRASADYVSALQFCDELERELTAVTDQRDEVSETLKSLTTTAFDLLASFERAREERDRLAEALDRITISGCGILCRQIANEALQSLTPNAERIHGDAGAGKPRETLPPLDDASC